MGRVLGEEVETEGADAGEEGVGVEVAEVAEVGHPDEAPRCLVLLRRKPEPEGGARGDGVKVVPEVVLITSLRWVFCVIPVLYLLLG